MPDKKKVLDALHQLSSEHTFIAYQEVENATGLPSEILDSILCELESEGRLKNIQYRESKVPVIFTFS